MEKKKREIIDAYFEDNKEDREINLFGFVIENSKTPSGNRTGALLCRDTKINLSYIKFLSNYSAGGGAAILAFKTAITLNGTVIFKENTAEISGGAITALNSSLTINAFTEFIKNKAINGNSGALRLFDTDLTVNNVVTFSRNQAGISEGTAFYCNKPVLGDKSKIEGAIQSSKVSWQQQ